MINAQTIFLSTATLLYIEDDSNSSSFFLKDKLKHVFKSILMAKNSQDALEIYQLSHPDFIIVDINFPNMDVVNFIKSIRRIDKKVQIALTYTYEDMDKILKIVEFGIAKIIVKPLTNTDLEALLETFLKSYRKNEIYKIAPFWIFDSKNFIIEGPTDSYTLTKREWSFLSILFHKNKTITYHEMKNNLWENSQMNDNAIHSFIKNIRKKLPPKVLLTVPGVGYRIAS